MVDTLGSRLASVRQRHGWSVRELSRRSGVSPQAITDSEVGKTEPSLSSIRRLARALSVSECWLAFGREGVEEAAIAGDGVVAADASRR